MNDIDIELPEATGQLPARMRPRGRDVAAALIGNGLEFYDFTTYTFFAIQIGNTFFPSQTPFVSLLASLGAFGIGFLFRPIGGIVLGRFSDRAGRRPAMLVSFTLMGLSILLLAVIPPFAWIGVLAPVLVVVARALQGFALGGEVGPTNAFLLEVAPVKERGLFSASQGASQNVASIIGGGVGLLLALQLSASGLESYGWRIAFLLGALTLPFGLFMRRLLPETLHREEELATHAPVEEGRSVLETHARAIVLTFFIFASNTVGTYVFLNMTTYARAILNMDQVASFGVSVVIGGMGMIGGLWAGSLSDRLGRKPAMIVPRAIFIVATYPVFLLMVREHSAFALLAGSAFLQFFSAASQGPSYAVLAESLPKRFRGTGFATIYALAISIFGGSTQFVITWLIAHTGNKMVPAWYAIGFSIVGLFAMAALRESAPMRVHRLERVTA